MSCSNVVYDVSDVSATMIFDYESENESPRCRLAVFVQTESEAARTQDIIVSSQNYPYKWIIDNPILLNNSADEWAGYTNLQTQNGEAMDSGRYLIEYKSLSGETSQAQFVISYPQKLKECGAIDFPDILAGEKYTEKIAVYNANGDMIFFGKKDASVEDAKSVKSRFPDADIMRLCYADNARRYACFMPSVELEEK